MADINIELIGLTELERDLIQAAKEFPKATEKVLRKEARELKNQITNAYTGSTIKSKSKNWEKDLQEKDKTSLVHSFTVGRVIKGVNGYTCSVNSKAPHYHLVEDGHEPSGMYLWYAKNPKYVKGKKIVAKIMARRSEHSEELGEKVLDKILKGGR